MKKIHVNLLTFRGTHYDFGFRQGEILQDTQLIENRRQQWKVRRPLFSIDTDETKNIFQTFSPSLWEELLGLKDALKWPMERVLLEFGGYRLKTPRSGCSIYVGQDFFIRNYDYHPKTYDGRLILYEPMDRGYATIGNSQKITGRCDGMNEKGLIMGYNFVNRRHPGDGFVCHMIGRIVLENCATIKEAIQLLKKIPHRGSFSYVLSDPIHQIPAIVEASPRGVYVRFGHFCTNHFEGLTEENRHVLEDSQGRCQIIEEYHQNNLTAKEAICLFNDPEKGVFSKLYKSWAGTLHTAAYFPRELKTWLIIGESKKQKEINFSDWLDGEEISFSKINGKVDTDIPFLHLEEANWFRKKK